MKTRKSQKAKEAQKKDNMENGRKTFNHALLLFLVVSVVAVSGCIVPGGDVFQGMFSPQRPATTEASADLITTQNINIIPNPPISADNGFTVSFEVKNNDEKEQVDNVNIDRYDTGLCNFKGEGSVSTGGGGTSALVKKEDNTAVAFFDVTCPGATTPKKIGFEIGNEVQANLIGLCSLSDSVKVTDRPAPLEDLTIKIGSAEKTMKYAEYEGTQYFCKQFYTRDVDDPRCKVEFDVTEGKLAMTFIDITIDVERTSCVNSDCVNDCRKTCADRDNLIDKISAKTPCVPYYDISSGFNGYCCSCKAGTRLSDKVTRKTTSVTGDIYMPLQTELIEWQLSAPTNEQLGNMPGSCGIKYKINYDFTAKTQASVDVINADKLSQMQRAGETPSASPTQSVGIGPIKVFFDFGASQPVRSGDILPVFITVEDRGSGLLDSGNVESGNLKLIIPQDFEEVSCTKFANSGGEYTNANIIPMIKKTSPQLRCSFKMPEVTDIKTFYISAELVYTYKLDSEVKISVNPTLVR